METTTTLIERSRLRVLWFNIITFGPAPLITLNFYDGPNHVFTWGRLWIELIIPVKERP